MKWIITILLAGILIVNASEKPKIRTGIDVLIEDDFKILDGKRVGLLTNPTGVTRTLVSTVDILAKAKNVKLVALFGPEHGVRGNVPAGGKISSYVDSATGIPVYSLYGETTKPTPEMLRNLDVLVYDIQDIGCRSYTYINTMALAMEAAAKQGIEVVILDRPNPLTGNKVEGNILGKEFQTLVGTYPTPYVYGLTCGEFAMMINNERWLTDSVICKLTVVKMKGWKRTMWWEDTGLEWVPPSPHVPTAGTALFYVAIGIMGELDSVNIGVGYTMPFQLVGTPWMDGTKLAERLNSLKLPGLFFRPLFYRPFYTALQGKDLGGVQVHILDRDRVNLTNTQFYIMQAIRDLYPEKDVLKISSPGRLRMFDFVMGSSQIRKALVEGEFAETLIHGWDKDVQSYMKIRSKYLLYE